MNLLEIEKIVNNLIDTFIFSGNVSLDLRNKGLEKKIKSDNTPVTNGDIQVNDLLTKKITDLTPNIKIISEFSPKLISDAGGNPYDFLDFFINEGFHIKYFDEKNI